MSCIIFFSSCILVKLFPKFCDTLVQLELPKAFSVGKKVDLLRPESQFLFYDFKDKDRWEDVEE